MDTYIFLKEASYLYIAVLSGLEFLILVCIFFAFDYSPMDFQKIQVERRNTEYFMTRPHNELKRFSCLTVLKINVTVHT